MNYKNRGSLSFLQLLSTHRLFMFWLLIPKPSEKDNTSFCRWTCQNIFFSETIAGKKWPYKTYKNLCNTTLFACLQIASSKHEEGWENLRQLSKALAMSRVCITSENSPNSSKCLDEAMYTRKKCSIASIKSFLEKHGNLMRHNLVYILSFSHTCPHMTTGIVAQLFYNKLLSSSQHALQTLDERSNWLYMFCSKTCDFLLLKNVMNSFQLQLEENFFSPTFSPTFSRGCQTSQWKGKWFLKLATVHYNLM